MKTIRTYIGKTGIVTVDVYMENGKEMFHVKHSTRPNWNGWFTNSYDAIRQAQSASRY